MAKSDSIVQMIQIQAYLEDVPEVGRHDFRRYPPHYGDPNYVYRPRPNSEIRDRECLSRNGERLGILERDRNECNGQVNRCLTPINNLCEGICEQDISRSPLPVSQ